MKKTRKVYTAFQECIYSMHAHPFETMIYFLVTGGRVKLLL
jgi:hypothetical protein